MSGFASFVGGFADTLPTGLDVAESIDKRRKTGAIRDVNRLLGEMEGYNPHASTGTFDPSTAAVPDDTVSARENPRRGFSGDDFATLQTQYFAAMGNLGSLEDYATARDNFGKMRMNRINDSIDRALLAYDSGDAEGAAEALRGASAFMSPGVTPEISVDPNSGAFVVVNYGSDGQPTGGYALTRDQLEDFRGQNTDYNAWASREQRDEEFDRTMELNREKLANEIRARNAEVAVQQTADARDAELDALDLANKQLVLRQSQLTTNAAERTHESNIGAELASDAATVAESGEKERQAGEAPFIDTWGEIEAMTSYDETEAEEHRARGTGDWADVQAGIFAGESGGDYDALFGFSNRPNERYSGVKVSDMTINQVLEFQRGGYGQWVAGETGGPVASPAGAYQIVGNTLEMLRDELGLTGDEKFDEAMQDRLGEHLWRTRGTSQWAGYRGGASGGGGGGGGGGRPGETAIPADDSAAAGDAAMDDLGYVVEEEDDNGETHRMVRDRWWYEPPNENGEVYMRAGMKAAADGLVRDIWKNNPSATPVAAANMVEGAFGRSQSAEVVIDEEDGTAYLDNGMERYVISDEVAANIIKFRDNLQNSQDFISMAPDAQSRPTPQLHVDDQAGVGLPAEAIPSSAAPPILPPGGTGAAPAAITAPAAAAAAAAAAPAGSADAWTGVPGNTGAPGAGAIPEPPSTRLPGRPDDTAVAPPPNQAPQMPPNQGGRVPPQQQAPQPGQTELPPAISQVPQIAEAVRQWIAAGKPSEGIQAIAELVMGPELGLPPELQAAIATEIRRMQGMRGLGGR